MVSVETRGMDDLLKAMKVLPERVQKNIMVGATRAAASSIKKEAKANVPVHLGVLKKSIGYQRRKTRSKQLVSFSVGPRSDLIKKGLEANGVQEITRESKKRGFAYSNYNNYGGYVEFGTSKMAAHPYLRPAYELKGEDAIQIVREYVAKRLDKEIAKASKQ